DPRRPAGVRVHRGRPRRRVGARRLRQLRLSVRARRREAARARVPHGREPRDVRALSRLQERPGARALHHEAAALEARRRRELAQMNSHLFSAAMRWGLVAAALVLELATLVAAKRGSRFAALLGVGAIAAVGALVGEGLIALTVRLAAPGQANFNEYRWVFLSPWGRFGLYLGGSAVAGIVLLAWRASRGASAWRRATLIGLRGGAAVAAMVVFLEPAV